MKPAHFNKILSQNEVRTYTQTFAKNWTVSSGDAQAFNADGDDVTAILIESVTNTSQSVLFQTKPNAPEGKYTVIVIGNMSNGDIVDVPGYLTITGETS